MVRLPSIVVSLAPTVRFCFRKGGSLGALAARTQGEEVKFGFFFFSFFSFFFFPCPNSPHRDGILCE